MYFFYSKRQVDYTYRISNIYYDHFIFYLKTKISP